MDIAALREHAVARKIRRFASKYSSKYCMLSGFGLWKLHPIPQNYKSQWESNILREWLR